MEEKLINLETAVLLKDKSFVEEVHNYFSKDEYEKDFSLKQGFNDNYWGDNYNHNWNDREPFKPFDENCYSAPPQSLVQKWLREIYGIDITIKKHNDVYNVMEITKYDSEEQVNIPIVDESLGWKDFLQYEEALETALQEALKQIA